MLFTVIIGIISLAISIIVTELSKINSLSDSNPNILINVLVILVVSLTKILYTIFGGFIGLVFSIMAMGKFRNRSSTSFSSFLDMLIVLSMVAGSIVGYLYASHIFAASFHKINF